MAQFGVRMWRRQPRRLDRLPNKMKTNSRRKPVGPPITAQNFAGRERAYGAHLEEGNETLAMARRAALLSRPQES